VYGDNVGNTIGENSSILSLNQISLVTISCGMRAVKLCYNNILQFLSGG